jgi:hypothetical protein
MEVTVIIMVMVFDAHTAAAGLAPVEVRLRRSKANMSIRDVAGLLYARHALGATV